MAVFGRRHWVHWSHSLLYMIPLLLLHLGYIIALAVLLRKYNASQEVIKAISANPAEPPREASIFVFRQQNTTAYAAWQYAPTTFAVLLGLLWEVVDAATRVLEPYFQLSSAEGATAENSLTLDYITAFTFFVPFRAASRRHFVVLIGSVVYIVAFIVIPAMSGSIWTINWAPIDSVTDGPLYATVKMNQSVIYAICGVNGLVFLLGSYLLYAFHARPCHLARNPKSVGGVASLVCESPGVLNLFRQIDSWVSNDLITACLRDVRFFLRPQPGENYDGAEFSQLQIVTNVPPNFHVLPVSENGQTRRQAHGNWLSAKRVWACEIFFLCANSIIVPAIGLGSFIAVNRDDYEKNIKPQVVKVTYVVIISISGSLFQWIHRDLQIFQPWRRFVSPTGTPQKRFTDAMSREYITDGQFFTLFKGAAKHSYIICMTAFSSLVFLVATIFFPIIYELLFNIATELSAVQNSTQGLDNATIKNRYNNQIPAGGISYYQGLYYWAIAIHALLFLNFLSILITRQCRAFMPRQPTTIGSQILYVCNSKNLLTTMINTSWMSGHQWRIWADQVERGVWFGWWGDEKGAFCGVDAVGEGINNRVQAFVYNGEMPYLRH